METPRLDLSLSRIARAVLLVVGSTAGWLAEPAEARADLASDVDRVARFWRAEGAVVTRLAPVFVEERSPKAFDVPRGKDDGCTTVLVLSDRNVELAVYPLEGRPFVLPPAPPEGEPGEGEEGDDEEESELAVESEAGIALTMRCGEQRAEMERILVELGSARGAVEVLVAHSGDALADVEALLPERVQGPRAPRGSPGAPLAPGPLSERLRRAEERAKKAGATHVVQVPMQSSSHGTGVFELRLGEGCHRLEVMSEDGGSPPADVDIEVRDAESGELLERDRGDAPDARADLCVGESTLLNVGYVGASGSTRVMLSSAMWPIPAWVSPAWGSRASAAFAAAFRRRPVPAPKSPPVAEAVGVQGVTSIPIEIEPDTCYLAAVAMNHGESAGLRLRAHVGPRGSVEELPGRPEGALVVFCSTIETVARVEVEVRGQAPSWVASVWRLGSR